MIARFRPTYSYPDIFLSLLSEENKALRELLVYLQDLYSTRYVFLFDQARVALYVLLKTLNINGGVISPAYNCIVVPDAVRFSGMYNQFADISLSDYNMTSESVERVVNSKSKILFATHQFGIPCDIEAMKFSAQKHKLILIEDAAAAMGAKIRDRLVGTFGKASIVSFQNTKVVTAIKGGCLIVYDKNIAERVRKCNLEAAPLQKLNFFKKAFFFKTATLPFMYSFIFPIWTKIVGSYTMPEKSDEKLPTDYLRGMNSPSADLIRRQMHSLADNVDKRANIANKYLIGLSKVKGVSLPKLKKGIKPSWVRFPIRVDDKLAFFKQVSERGVDLAWTFSYSCPKEYGAEDSAPHSLQAAQTVLNLPLYPDLSDQEVNKVVTAVRQAT